MYRDHSPLLCRRSWRRSYMVQVAQQDSPAHDRTKGCVLGASSIVGEGAVLEFGWKAWASTSCGQLRWELRRCLSSVGFDDGPKSQKLAHRLREFMPLWRGFAHRFGFDLGSHFFRCRMSAMAKAQLSDDTSADQDASISTAWLLVLGLYFSASRTPAVLRPRVARAFDTSLGFTLDVASTSGLRQGLLELGPQIWGLCSVFKGHDGLCDHVFLLRRRVSDIVDDRAHVLLWKALAEAWSFSASCKAIAKHLGDALLLVREWVDAGCDKWGSWDLSTQPSRRVKDEHLKRALCECLQSSKRAKTVTDAVVHLGASAAPQLARHLVERSWSELRAASWIALRNPDTCSVCFDGFRIGKPAKELLVCAVTELGRNLTTILPPVDPTSTASAHVCLSCDVLRGLTHTPRGSSTAKFSAGSCVSLSLCVVLRQYT